MGHGPFENTGNLRRDISLRLTVISRQQSKRFDKSVEGLAVTRSQWSAIAVVARHSGASQRTIADLLDMSEAAAGRLIDRLCNDGLLERREREDDRRGYSVFLTPAAQPLLAKLGMFAAEQEEIAFAGMSEADLIKLRELLGQIYRNIST